MQINTSINMNNMESSSASGNVSALSGGNAKDKQDGVLASLYTQLQNVKDNIQELSQNKDLSMEEKVEKRKDYQSQLQDINRQISERKQELYKEEHDKENKKNNNVDDDSQNKEEVSSFSTSQMKGMIKGSDALSYAKKGQKLKGQLEGKAKVLERELLTDMGRATFPNPERDRIFEEKGSGIAQLKGKASSIGNKIGSKLSEVINKEDDEKKSVIQSKNKKQEEEKEKEKKKKKLERNKGNYIDQYF